MDVAFSASQPQNGIMVNMYLTVKSIFDSGCLVGNVTLRLLKPACSLDDAWCQEELQTATARAVCLLRSRTVPNRVGKVEAGTSYTEITLRKDPDPKHPFPPQTPDLLSPLSTLFY